MFPKLNYAMQIGLIKDDVKSVLRIGSAHNKGGYEQCPDFASFELF